MDTARRIPNSVNAQASSGGSQQIPWQLRMSAKEIITAQARKITALEAQLAIATQPDKPRSGGSIPRPRLDR
jgi:hypothetical protein